MGKHKRRRKEEELYERVKRLERRLHRKNRRSDDDTDDNRESRSSQSRSRSRSTSKRTRSRNRTYDSDKSTQHEEMEGGNLETLPPDPPELALTTATESLPVEIENLLGQEGTSTVTVQCEFHQSLNTRWLSILANGLTDENRESLLKKHNPPINCGLLLPPKLNEEVAAAMNENGVKRDKRISDQQEVLAAAITSIGKTLTKMITVENNEHIENLSDSVRLLCDIFHTNTCTRRSLILPGLNKEIKDTLEKTPVSEYLFGDKLQERVTTCKAVKKSAQELKNTVPRQRQKNQSLNYKGPQRPPAQRLSGPKSTQKRAPNQKPPANRQKPFYRRQDHQHHHRRR